MPGEHDGGTVIEIDTFGGLTETVIDMQDLPEAPITDLDELTSSVVAATTTSLKH